MTEIVGIRRNGHRYTITVTGRAGTATVTRTHCSDCPCRARAPQSARVARRRKSGRTV